MLGFEQVAGLVGEAFRPRTGLLLASTSTQYFDASGVRSLARLLSAGIVRRLLFSRIFLLALQSGSRRTFGHQQWSRRLG